MKGQVFILFVAMFSFLGVESSSGNLLGNIFMCSPSAEYVLNECHLMYERERYEFGGESCCIYAKFRECLKERMSIACRRSIQQLVDAKIGLNRPRDCLGVYYPSAWCWFFYNVWIIAAVIGVIILSILSVVVLCCVRCLKNMFPAKVDNK
jgi:hypothetical protein